MSQTADKVFGLLAEFDGPNALVGAANRARRAGYVRFDAHSPYPIHDMDLAMGLKRSKLGWLVLAAAAAGAATGMGLQWYANAWEYPLITQGKPYFSWQAFLVVTFELAVLFAAFAAVFGMFALNGLPQWYHPALKQAAFAGASDNRFFLVIEAEDAKFDVEGTEKFLKETGALAVTLLHE